MQNFIKVLKVQIPWREIFKFKIESANLKITFPMLRLRYIRLMLIAYGDIQVSAKFEENFLVIIY